jgi:hypothetical protein
MSRDFYDRTAAEWRAAAEAVHKAAGDNITLPVGHLTLIFHGYQQYQQERAAALAWISRSQQAGHLDETCAAYGRHALGDLTDDQLADQLRAAANHQEGL